MFFPLRMKTNAFYPPRQGIHSNGCWFFETSVKQNLLLGSVEVGNRNGFSAEVRPVQVLVDPVHRNPHRGLDIVYHFFMYTDLSSFVQYSPAGKKWVSPKWKKSSWFSWYIIALLCRTPAIIIFYVQTHTSDSQTCLARLRWGTSCHCYTSSAAGKVFFPKRTVGLYISGLQWETIQGWCATASVC